ncbi:LysR family transcriptional regulator [Streptomyces drozdowiczii]|uniref:LysR family transcriptional regulator n=1 Tax=Streptomyces drozdowiczii TaxID=202862 RepID=UPI0031E858D1
MLDVRRMQILRSVVTSGSVTAAAAHLGYTPSAISQQMTALEKQVGLPLLERVGRGVQPTAAGLILTDYAARIGQQVAEAETALSDLRAGRSGHISLRYFATAGAELVAPAVASLRRKHPHVRIDLGVLEADDPLQEVIRHQADLAIVVQPRNSRREGVQLVRLVDDPYLVVLPKDHRLARKERLDLSDLADEPWVGSESSDGTCLDIIMTACSAAGFTPDFVVQSEDYATAQGFVAARLGVALIPRLGLANRHHSVTVREVRNPQPLRSIQAAVRDVSLDQVVVRSMLSALREAASVHRVEQPAGEDAPLL